MISNNILSEVILKDKFNRGKRQVKKITLCDELRELNKIKTDKIKNKFSLTKIKQLTTTKIPEDSERHLTSEYGFFTDIENLKSYPNKKFINLAEVLTKEKTQHIKLIEKNKNIMKKSLNEIARNTVNSFDFRKHGDDVIYSQILNMDNLYNNFDSKNNNNNFNKKFPNENFEIFLPDIGNEKGKKNIIKYNIIFFIIFFIYYR
jgi:hypothetical protein